MLQALETDLDHGVREEAREGLSGSAAPFRPPPKTRWAAER